jgi:hypothetical protein
MMIDLIISTRTCMTEEKRCSARRWGEDRRSGKFAGYCHIAFAARADAQWAVETQHGSVFGGRALKIDAASDDGRRPEDAGAAAAVAECTLLAPAG